MKHLGLNTRAVVMQAQDNGPNLADCGDFLTLRVICSLSKFPANFHSEVVHYATKCRIIPETECLTQLLVVINLIMVTFL